MNSTDAAYLQAINQLTWPGAIILTALILGSVAVLVTFIRRMTS